MHSGPFDCPTKPDAKRAELDHKFVPRSRVEIFHSKRTRSTPLDRKLMFWGILYYCLHSGPFGCLTKLGAKRTELVQKFVPRSRVKIFRDEHTRSTPLDPKLMLWGISYYLCAFGAVCCLTKLGAKRTELVQKFVPQSRIGIFRHECT